MKKNVNLSPYTSFGTGGTAENFIDASSSIELEKFLSKEFIQPITVIGTGSNILIADSGIKGTVVRLKGGEIKELDDVTLNVDAGVIWDDLVTFTVANKLWGMELMSGIPSSIGGAVVGNIAAYGQAVSDTLVSIEVFDLHTRQTITFPASELQLSYRSSGLQKESMKHLVILRATFKLSHQPTTDLAYESALVTAHSLQLDTQKLNDRRKIILETRRKAGSLLNKSSRTAGSFFKNPLVSAEQAERIIHFDETGKTQEQISKMNKIHGGDSKRVSAAHVLLASGYKRGQSWGNVRLHPDHVLKVENTGKATSQEIYDVVKSIVNDVHTKLGVTLEPEVKFLGNFTS